MAIPTINDTLGEFNAGVYMQQAEAVLKEVAKAVINHGEKGKKGKVTLTFTLARLGEDSDMVNVEHDWSYEHPTMRGKKTENNKSSTPMCVSKHGHLTVYPLEQTDMFDVVDSNVSNFRGGK
jgi:hypothetical protein